ncbi:MAG: hypothetical protein IJI01_01000 [Butyrivibrio sp.]|uniref:hypothetical protein n=1 Tax=Butyrivibrio sp. TaxID=28121 RepID=UPI0025C63D29|nr:hypothetical protein [Butyrivibrio sp.]MBQ6587237.1 hypothetical protein [Butyrivibrio sp.]
MSMPTLEKIHRIILKMPSFLEKIVAAILLVGVVYSCVQLALHVFTFSSLDFGVYVEDILVTAFNAVIVIEFIRMLIKHSMNTVIEVLIFAIARSLVVGHEKPLEALVSIVSIAILLLCRRFLFHEFDFKEEE